MSQLAAKKDTPQETTMLSPNVAFPLFLQTHQKHSGGLKNFSVLVQFLFHQKSGTLFGLVFGRMTHIPSSSLSNWNGVMESGGVIWIGASAVAWNVSGTLYNVVVEVVLCEMW